ncbi:armadillo repeat-containing protein 6 [Hyalella azteca]|uniref:Armadillo repeat-containing protein 6 n=1 Tax=Hyalella azteca TaxID=294128 RepID=A0A8B7P611_HYAAZ|nr:armadillo repeat-containing protein 6 [Hyalella azteca]
MTGPKIISQETYDEVVVENVKDFDKPLDEAIQDTIQEFEAQGVLLANIIKEVKLDANNEKVVHPVLESLEVIKSATSDDRDEPDCHATTAPVDLLGALTTFSDECKISLPHRVLATKYGAYSYLMRLLKQAKDDGEKLSRGLTAMQALSDGNPDVLEDSGVNFMLEMMECWHSDMQSNIMEVLARWCHSCNIKHEGNRQLLFNAGVPHALVTSLQGCSAQQHQGRMVATLKALRSFTLDDDIRVEIGRAHEHCRHLVEEEGLIAVALQVIKGAVACSMAGLAGEALATLSCVCVRAEYCQQATEAGALDVINSILINFPDSAIINKQSIALIATLAGDDNVKSFVMKSGTPSLIVKAMDKHQLSAGVCSAGCSAVSMLALRHPQNAAQLVDCGAAGAVLQAMKQHQHEKQVQKMGCLALRNLCSRSPQAAELLRLMQADGVVQAALSNHGDAVKDLAKSALRDMGVDVALEERWHGKGHELAMGDP